MSTNPSNRKEVFQKGTKTCDAQSVTNNGRTDRRGHKRTFAGYFHLFKHILVIPNKDAIHSVKVVYDLTPFSRNEYHLLIRDPI